MQKLEIFTIRVHDIISRRIFIYFFFQKIIFDFKILNHQSQFSFTYYIYAQDKRFIRERIHIYFIFIITRTVYKSVRFSNILLVSAIIIFLFFFFLCFPDMYIIIEFNSILLFHADFRHFYNIPTAVISKYILSFTTFQRYYIVSIV